MNHIPEHFRKNIHPKDEKIQFMENDHSYFVDGKKIKFSVSEIIKIIFQNLIQITGRESKQ